jgi:hypothetical protein
MPTPNYGWNTPTVNGDLGAWGTKINQCLTDADEDLKAVETAASAASTAASAAQTTANSAYTLSTTNATKIATKVLVSTIAPTGWETADDGVLWCQVAS